MKRGHYIVERSLNNNVLVVRTPDGKEEILIGRGLGFGMRRGNPIDPEDPRIEKRFTLANPDNRAKFKQLYTVVSDEVIGVAEEIIAHAAPLLGPLHEHIHVALPDHIGFALKRLMGGLEIDNPFLEEIKCLYPEAWGPAADGAKLMEKRFGVKIPDSEIGFLTLHLQAARERGRLSETLRVTEGVRVAVQEMERLLNRPLPRESLDYARFVTHVRFALQRALTKQPIVNPLKRAIRERLPESFRQAQAVADRLEERLHLKLPEDEVAYLAMHVARFTGERDASGTFE
ncbi:transcriptional antiterminator, BglG family [Planifilum fulgidum]|jgi:transcriptional antiterminator|uniref:Transcriptional antiterminator, BglG family n=1 Tax=Planifilum fulgidum TaxID=201973 RepID=A0A1I2P6Y0_9BACL|nr:transcription antiterminator [Planifilum fulgidum]SFG11878.1 transcriptional antiterminator, BglG family [Planifilum fulgidum]